MLAVHSTGELTLQETTVSGGRNSPNVVMILPHGGGVANYGGTLTVLQQHHRG